MGPADLPFDRAFLARLLSDDPAGWCRAIHGQFRSVPSGEWAGALFLSRGRAVGIAWGELARLHGCEVSPGALLARGFWLGADAVLPFHTQLAVAKWEVEPEDLAFAQRLRNLAPLIGLDPLDHLFVTSAEVPVRLGAADGLEEPVALEEMESWTRTVPARKRPRYRHPHGHTWAGTGDQPPAWVEEALAQGFRLDDFELPTLPDLDAPRGAPPGAEFVRGVYLGSTAAVELPEPFEEIAGHDALEIGAVDDALARALSPLARREADEPWTGVVTFGEEGAVTAPRAGWVASESAVAARPSLLFRTALVDRAAWAVTFSTTDARRARITAGRREQLRRFVFAGQLLGLPVRDHLVLRSDGRWLSLARRGRRGAWPRVPPLAEPLWAPFRRPNQASVVFRHPVDGQLWRGRGPKPRWLRQLLEEGFELEELKEYL